jgi:hypothetical protein
MTWSLKGKKEQNVLTLKTHKSYGPSWHTAFIISIEEHFFDINSWASALNTVTVSPFLIIENFLLFVLTDHGSSMIHEYISDHFR